jgi:hypothetical protein
MVSRVKLAASYIPESVTISSWVKPLSENLWVSWPTLKFGGGKLEKVSEASETMPSLLPAGTS